jgi:hypothetical protein
MTEGTLIHADEGHRAIVLVPVEHADEGTVPLEIVSSDGAEYALLSPQGALQVAMALIAAVEGSGAMELAKEVLEGR